MRNYTKNRRRPQLRVESLEGKTLLSAGSVMHHVAQHVAAAPIVAQAAAAFSGTLTGPYSSVHAPYYAYIQSYSTSGTLSGVGSTHLYGTLIVRPHTPAGRFDGQLVLRNSGGTMILNVYASGTPATYFYKVVVARGSDAPFKGGSGSLTIAQSPTFSVPYYSYGQSRMAFTLG